MLRNDGPEFPGKQSVSVSNNTKNSPSNRNNNVKNFPPPPFKNNINNLRPNDGHNSAFANYTK